MKNVKVTANINEESIIIVLEDNATLNDLLENETFKEFFDGSDDPMDKDSVVMFGGTEVTDTLIGILENVSIPDNTEIVFDGYGEVPQSTVTATEANADETEEGKPVMVTVAGIAGNTLVAASHGVTTVDEVIHDERALRLLGLTETQISNCRIYLNDEEVARCMLDTMKVKKDDVVRITPAPAGTKGR